MIWAKRIGIGILAWGIPFALIYFIVVAGTVLTGE